LFFSGNIISTNITDLNISDPVIGLGRGPNNTPLTTNDGKDRGTEMWYYTTSEKSAFFGYDNSTGKLFAATDITNTADVITVNAYGNLVVGGLEADTISATSASLTSLGVTVNITSGNVSGTTGAFTNVSGNGSALTALNMANAGSGTLAVARGGTGVTTSTGSGAVVLGTSPTFTTQISVPSIVKTGTNGVGNIGQSDNAFNTVFAKATSAQYADLAENYSTDSDYPPATVVVFGGEKEITASTRDHDAAIAGVISTKPAYLMNSGPRGLPVALQGRVPCQVVGQIHKGDRLVASDIKGVAKVLEKDKYEPGCIIGKALEDYNSEQVGTIEVVVGRV
jgi:hypothetical protein